MVGIALIKKKKGEVILVKLIINCFIGYIKLPLQLIITIIHNIF